MSSRANQYDTSISNRRSGLIVLLCFSMYTPAFAAIFTVGNPVGSGQCTHGTIQSAINQANSSAGADTVRLTRSLTYEPEANSINTSQELTVEGGYATCTQATSDATKTVVSGAGGAAEPVFRITANTGGIVHLRNLTISGGDEDGSGYGGGIFFNGNGVLEVRDSLITANVAGSGGGIYAQGTGSDTELVIGANVVISNNTARYNGGGIVADQIEMSMLEPGSILFGNEALGLGGTGGYGGGLYVRGDGRSSFATIGSGAPVFGAVSANNAVYGGGIAVGGVANEERSELRIFATEANRPAQIVNNVASIAGGGIHIRSEDSLTSGGLYAKAYLYNAELKGNEAPQGAAVQVQGSDTAVLVESPAYFWFNIGGLPEGAAPCPVGGTCGLISGNRTVSGNGQPTEGAIINAQHDANVALGALSNGIIIEGNQGGRLIQSSNGGDFNPVELRNVLVADNQFSRELISTSGGDSLFIHDSTIASNMIGAGSVLAATDKAIELRRSILWHPGIPILARSGGSLVTEYIDASDNTSLGGPFAAYTFEPRFIDPAHGDYRLRAGSGAIDFAPAIAGDDRDVFGLPHDQDMPIKANTGGVRDIGAFERQDLLPLVLNADFDYSDLRLWTWFAGEWDGTQNVAGGSGSGSWKYASPDFVSRAEIGRQCIHLPGPGRYFLNGRGKGGGSTIQTRDYAKLGWELRRSGTEQCNAGVANVSGELGIGSGTSWGQAAHPAIIDLAPQDWTPTSSITVTLIAEDGGVSFPRNISAWFDGITLEVDGSDVIFADGFETFN